MNAVMRCPSSPVKVSWGRYMFSFNPAISTDAAKRLRREIRSWRLHQRSSSTLEQLADEVNPVVRGWINYCVSRGHARLDRRAVGSMV